MPYIQNYTRRVPPRQEMRGMEARGWEYYGGNRWESERLISTEYSLNAYIDFREGKYHYRVEESRHRRDDYTVKTLSVGQSDSLEEAASLAEKELEAAEDRYYEEVEERRQDYEMMKALDEFERSQPQPESERREEEEYYRDMDEVERGEREESRGEIAIWEGKRVGRRRADY